MRQCRRVTSEVAVVCFIAVYTVSQKRLGASISWRDKLRVCALTERALALQWDNQFASFIVLERRNFEYLKSEQLNRYYRC